MRALGGLTMKRIKELWSKLAHWLAWKLAGQKIYHQGVVWAASNIYLYSQFPKQNLVQLPNGITVADIPVLLTSGMSLDGSGHILTQAFNKPLKYTVEALGERIYIRNTIILGSHASGKSMNNAVIGYLEPA